MTSGRPGRAAGAVGSGPARSAAAPPSPPSPRKSPRQRRSQATVGFILEAARRILYEEGIEALTTRRVAEQSGVAVGSLYQYFANRDAILARLAEEEARRESKALQQHYASVRHLPLEEYLARAVERIVESERCMLAFGGEFYRRYSQHYHVVQRAGRKTSGDILDQETLTRDTLRSFELHVGEIGEPDTTLAAYLLARGIPAMLGTLVAERPDLLSRARLEEILGRIAAAIVDAPNVARKANGTRSGTRKAPPAG